MGPFLRCSTPAAVNRPIGSLRSVSTYLSLIGLHSTPVARARRACAAAARLQSARRAGHTARDVGLDRPPGHAHRGAPREGAAPRPAHPPPRKPPPIICGPRRKTLLRRIPRTPVHPEKRERDPASACLFLQLSGPRAAPARKRRKGSGRRAVCRPDGPPAARSARLTRIPRYTCPALGNRLGLQGLQVWVMPTGPHGRRPS